MRINDAEMICPFLLFAQLRQIYRRDFDSVQTEEIINFPYLLQALLLQHGEEKKASPDGLG